MTEERLTPETHPALFAALRASGEREMRANLERRHPPPFLVTDSYEFAEDVLRICGRSTREFRMVTRAEQLRGIEGDVYSMYSGRGGNSAWLLWRELDHRRVAGRINDLGEPPHRTHRER